MGDALVGSAWAAACSTVTVGAVWSTVNVCAVDVPALPAASDWLAVTVEAPSVLIGVVSVAVHPARAGAALLARRCR